MRLFASLQVLEDATSLVDVPDSEPVRMLAASALLEAAAMGINTRNTANDVSLKAAKMLCGGAVLRSCQAAARRA